MPSANDLYASRLLTSYAAGAAQDLKNFAWNIAAPRIDTMQESGKILKFDVGDQRRVFAGPRGPGAKVPRGDFRASKLDYATTLMAAGSAIDQNVANNAEPIAKLAKRKAGFVTENLWLAIEQMWADIAMVTGVWGTTKAGVSSNPTPGVTFLRWDDPGSSPIKDVQTARSVGHLTSGGYDFNTLVVGYYVHQALKTNPEIIDRIRFTTDESVIAEILKRYFEVDNYVVCKAVKNTANRGSTDSMSMICGNHALLCYVDPQPAVDKDKPTAMLCPWWIGMEGSIDGLQVAEIPLVETRELMIEIQAAPDFKIVSSSMGYMMLDAVSTPA